MLLEVFGPGCSRCQALEKHVKEAVERSGGLHQVVKVEDYGVMAARGVLSTPALALEGQLRSQGRVLSVEDVLALIQG